jgi:C1A family cysteine protease
LKSQVSSDDKNFIGAPQQTNTVDLRQKLLPIRNQGSICACVGFSSCTMKEYQEESTEYFSPTYIYNLRSNYPEDCMTIKNALDILSDSGVCYENTYPYTILIDELTRSKEIEESKQKNIYNSQSSSSNILQQANIEAKKFKIISYAQITDIDSLKNALGSFGPCLIAFPVYNYTNELWMQNNDEILLGGHCMTVVGYDTDSFIIRNTWGTTWGNDGYTNYPFDQWGIHWEVWTSTNYSKLALSSMPGTIKPATPTNPYGLTNVEKPITNTNTTSISYFYIFVIIMVVILIIVGIVIYNYNVQQ